MKYQIGDFSKISRLSIKTLRYYHECGLLEPAFIEDESGYRYYDEKSFEKVKVITTLKEFEFSLKDIKDILDNCNEDFEMLDYMINKHKEIGSKIEEYKRVQKKIEDFIEQTKQTEELHMQNSHMEIIIKNVPDIMIASERFIGKYQEVGKYYKKLFKACGRHVCGSPFSLYYDNEFKEEDADIEACVPVKMPIASEGINSSLLKGGKALTIIHHGSYESLGESYKILFDYINNNKLKTSLPNREIYLKGPGLIIPRSPKKFVTEIQIFTQVE